MQTYDVFISYSRKDYRDEHKHVIKNNYVTIIKEELEQKGLTYWFDEEGIYSSQAFARIIAENIQKAKVFLFISSENSNSSEWTCREIATAIMYNKPILPVKIDSTNYAPSVILYLSNLDYIDLPINVENGLNNISRSVEKILCKDGVETMPIYKSPYIKKVSIKDTILTFLTADEPSPSEDDTLSSIIHCYTKILSFKGVVNRKTYWLFVLSVVTVLLILFLLFFSFCILKGLTVTGVWTGTISLIAVTSFILTFSATWRRLRDAGDNGVSLLLSILLLIGLYILPISTFWLIIGLIFLVSMLITFLHTIKKTQKREIDKEI